MAKNIKARVIALVSSVALLGGGAWIAAGTTGAYFSDTHTGSVSGTVGSIRVTPTGGTGTDNTDLAFSNLLPGASQSVTLNFENTGRNVEDVYVVFNNPTALSALNSLGTYGEIHLASNGVSLFDSANLNDRASTCGDFAASGCWPLKSTYKVASNVSPGDKGFVTFSFGYAGKLKTQSATSAPAPVWNTFPVAGQVTTNVADGSGAGLPYQLVATQPGVTPGS